MFLTLHLKRSKFQKVAGCSKKVLDFFHSAGQSTFFEFTTVCKTLAASAFLRIPTG